MCSTRQSTKGLEHRRDSSLHSLSSVIPSNGLSSKDSNSLSNTGSRDSMETISADQNGRIIVAVRVRPLSSKEISAGQNVCCRVTSESTISIVKYGDENGYLKSQQTSINEYAFDFVFNELSSQRDVFEKTTLSFLPTIINGQNVTVFAYGSTGAGKTHTMLGNTRADTACLNAEAGIIPNAVQELISLIDAKKKFSNHKLSEKWAISVSFIEVYNEQVYDLIEGNGKVLSLREDQDRGVVVAAGATEQPVCTYDDVIELLMIGNRNRKTEATQMNTVSSRSHAVLLLTVKHSKKASSSASAKEVVTESKLSLIDLAGSERASATNNRGARLHEGANINKSLLALANCINSLAANNQGGISSKRLNVKYRDSKLTHLLKSSLEGNCNLVMIANINPSDAVFEDSHNTLKYANRAKSLKVPVLLSRSKDALLLKDSDGGSVIELEANFSSLDEENAWLRSRVSVLEELVQDLQSFKTFTLSQGSTCAGCKDLLLLKPSLDLQFRDPTVDEFDAPVEKELDRISSISDCSVISSFATSIEHVAVEPTVDVVMIEASETLPETMTSTAHLVEDLQNNSKKRRCSFLPTALRKRKSIVGRPTGTLNAPGSAKKVVLTPSATMPTPLKSSSRASLGRPPSSHRKTPTSEVFMDSNGEPGKMFLCGPPSAVKTSREMLNERRNSRCVGKRKTSMAQVSAMLDSLSQQNQEKTISVSLRSAAGRASLFRSILTTTTAAASDENAMFASNISDPAQSDGAMDSAEAGAKGVSKGGGVRTRSQATAAIDI